MMRHDDRQPVQRAAMHQLRPGRQRSSRLAVWFGIVAILIFLLGGCGGDDESGQDATSTEPVATVEPTPTATAEEPDPTATPTQSEASSDVPRAEPPDVDSPETVAFVDGLNSFAFDLYQAAIEDEDGNLIYSPTSIELAFSMVYAGARGDTEAQMADILGFLPQEDQHPAANSLDQHLASLGEAPPPPGMEQGDPFQLNIANAIWGQEGFPFLDAFLETLAMHYGAEMGVADFVTQTEAARQEINAWVAERTEGRIEEAVPEGVLNEMTRLVLANAIYFNAAWLYPFDEGATADGSFTLLDDSQVSVPMMHQSGARMSYAEGDGYQVVVLPYTGQEVEMVIILPAEDHFAEIEAGLTADFFRQARAGAETRDVDLTMPTFDFESDLELHEILPDMGMAVPFDPDVADLTGIAPPPADLFIAAALHQANISVDEKGTEAAAVTIIAIEDESAPVPVELRIDRPFIFAIVDRETSAILFLGRVTDPSG